MSLPTNPVLFLLHQTYCSLKYDSRFIFRKRWPLLAKIFPFPVPFPMFLDNQCWFLFYFPIMFFHLTYKDDRHYYNILTSMLSQILESGQSKQQSCSPLIIFNMIFPILLLYKNSKSLLSLCIFFRKKTHIIILNPRNEKGLKIQ